MADRARQPSKMGGFHDMLWEKMFHQLEQFKDANGHCRVPDDPKGGLGKWVSNLRQKRKRGVLRKDRENRLTAIGFEWSLCHMACWEDRFQDLAEYKKSFGTCSVPLEYDKQLSRWVIDQRRLKRTGKLLKYRQEKLEKLGLEWAFKRLSWEDRLQELIEFKNTHGVRLSLQLLLPAGPPYGRSSSPSSVSPRVLLSPLQHCCVPSNHDSGLGRWVSKLRQLKRKGLLQSEREQELSQVGLEWHTHNGATTTLHADERFTSKKKADAPSYVVKSHSMSSGTPLKDPPGRAKMFGLECRGDLETWEDRLEELVRYKHEHGHCNVPRQFPGGLGHWVETQRRERKIGALMKDRQELLDLFGMEWEGSQTDTLVQVVKETKEEPQGCLQTVCRLKSGENGFWPSPAPSSRLSDGSGSRDGIEGTPTPLTEMNALTWGEKSVPHLLPTSRLSDGSGSRDGTAGTPTSLTDTNALTWEKESAPHLLPNSVSRPLSNVKNRIFLEQEQELLGMPKPEQSLQTKQFKEHTNQNQSKSGKVPCFDPRPDCTRSAGLGSDDACRRTTAPTCQDRIEDIVDPNRKDLKTDSHLLGNLASHQQQQKKRRLSEELKEELPGSDLEDCLISKRIWKPAARRDCSNSSAKTRPSFFENWGSTGSDHRAGTKETSALSDETQSSRIGYCKISTSMSHGEKQAIRRSLAPQHDDLIGLSPKANGMHLDANVSVGSNHLYRKGLSMDVGAHPWSRGAIGRDALRKQTGLGHAKPMTAPMASDWPWGNQQRQHDLLRLHIQGFGQPEDNYRRNLVCMNRPVISHPVRRSGLPVGLGAGGGPGMAEAAFFRPGSDLRQVSLQSIRGYPMELITGASIKGNCSCTQQSQSPPVTQREVQKQPHCWIGSERIRENDILCGRSKVAYSHPGTTRYRWIIKYYSGKYQRERSRDEKGWIIKDVITELRNSGCQRFLKQGDGNEKDQWYELEYPQVYEKVGHNLRSCKT